MYNIVYIHNTAAYLWDVKNTNDVIKIFDAKQINKIP